jgi:ABC-2 type transport system ATP-binding protein
LLDGCARYDRLTARENLELFAGLVGIDRSRVGEVMERTGIRDLARRPAGKLSRGQRQRLALARAVLHAPALLFLDEPTSGLDPSAAAALHALLRQLHDEGVTIVLSSHDMAEVDLLCSRVAILDRGSLMACDSPTHLKAAYRRREIRATVQTAGG